MSRSRLSPAPARARPRATAEERTAARTTTTAASTNDPTLNQWAITYTGGKLQKAAGSPVNIGYVNDDSLFPEATIGVKAAVAYANAELNGLNGHPINLKSCEVVTASDGAKCGAQMANDPSINLVLTGTLLDGNAELYNALNGKKAVIIGNGVTPADFTTPAGEAFVAGAPGVLAGMAQFAVSQFHPKKVAILANDNPAGHAGVALIMQPIFTKANAAGEGGLRAQRGERHAGAIGDVGHRGGRLRRLRVDPHAPVVHRHVRRDQVARRPPERRDDRLVLRHADDHAPPGRTRHRRLPRRLVLRRLRLQLLPAQGHAGHAGVGHEHVPGEGAPVRQARARCDDARVQRLRRTDVRQRAHGGQVHQRARRGRRP